MALKTFNPTTPGQRQLVIVDRTGLHRGKPVKALSLPNIFANTSSRGAATMRVSFASSAILPQPVASSIAMIGTIMRNIEYPPVSSCY